MKKIFTLFSILIFISNLSFSQKINFEKSLEVAQQKSLSQNKILFVKISLPESLEANKYDAEIIFPQVVSFYNDKFISYKNNLDEASTRDLTRKYGITKYPALLFFDSKGGILLSESGSFSTYHKYLSIANQALELSTEKSLIEFEEEYKKGKFDGDFLKNYITKRIKSGLTNNALLLDQYVEFLKVSDLSDYQQVLFILKAGPLAYGKAQRLVSINNRIIDSIYKTESKELRTAIHDGIISNTMNYAISRKNIAWANAAAQFTRSTWNPNATERNKNASSKLIEYYYGVRDTANYLKNASFHYNVYYMGISKDSVEKSKINNQDLEMLKNEAIAALKSGDQRSYQISTSRNMVASVAVELNNAAFQVFLTGTKNPRYLTAALNWSKRSLEFEQIYGFYDTLAHIQYRLGSFDEAELNQNKAIELAKIQKVDIKNLQSELDKIKNRTL